jgi:membrane dipeptidase
MEEGGLDGAFFAVFVGQRERDDAGNAYAKRRALQLFDSIHSAVQRNAGMARLAFSASDLGKIHRTGEIAVFIGIENGFTLGRDVSLVKHYYGLGARYITLCHTSNNDICDSSTDPGGPEHHGLSEFGREVVHEMNRVGMMIDVSHISDEAFYEVLEITEAPVIASHSNARAVCDHPRNLTDDMISKLAANGGVVQLCVLSEYVARTEAFPARDSAKMDVIRKYGHWNELDDSTRKLFDRDWLALDDVFPPRLASVEQFCDHVDHVVNLVGMDHVGFGSDFDGGAGLEDCYDVTGLPGITFELLRRGYSRAELDQFWSGNFLRVMKEVEAAASSR